MLNGVGQSKQTLWSVQLQKLLGNKFVVLNLAIRGAPTMAAPEYVVESFVKAKTPVIFVVDSENGDLGTPDGDPINRYQYWQAHAAGFLNPNEDRDAVARLLDKDGEQEFRGELSEYLRFDDLWSYVTYRDFSTVWLPPLASIPWWAPHSRASDLDTDTGDAAPVQQRFAPFPQAHEADIIRSRSSSAFLLDSNGHWQPNSRFWDPTASQFQINMSPEARQRTVLIFPRRAPYFYQPLTPAEQERHRLLESLSVKLGEESGFTCITYQGFTDDDYHDPVHLVPAGGKKLAKEVAPAVLEIAHKLYGIDSTLQPLDP